MKELTKGPQGIGVIGVFQYGTHSGIFSVMPNDALQLPSEGFYAAQITTNEKGTRIFIPNSSSVTTEEYGKLVGQPVKGIGIAGLITAPIWSFKRFKEIMSKPIKYGSHIKSMLEF